MDSIKRKISNTVHASCQSPGITVNDVINQNAITTSIQNMLGMCLKRMWIFQTFCFALVTETLKIYVFIILILVHIGTYYYTKVLPLSNTIKSLNSVHPYFGVCFFRM